MEILIPILSHPFTWGLLLGLVFAGLALKSIWSLRTEVARQKRFLGEKLQFDAENWGSLKLEAERLRGENENLRAKIADLSRTPAGRAGQELDILLRAERAMILSAPGFASAWELAKSKAAEELAQEATGSRTPGSLIGRLLGGGRRREALPVGSAPQTADPSAGGPQNSENL